MTDPISFDSASPRFALPLLYAAQAQKEVFVNEALAITDALMHCAIEGTASAPPAVPAEGTSWLIASSATGDWAGQDGKIACRQAGNWLFIAPRDGMLVLNRTTGQQIHFASGWKAPSLPAAPSGGATIDAEARAALASLVTKLQIAGILPAS